MSFRRGDDTWTEPVNIFEMMGLERGGSTPVLSPDGKYLFDYAAGQTWWVDAGIIEELRPGAAFLLVQHADQDLPFQKAFLVWLEGAYRSGALPPQMGEGVALLTDRVLAAEGKPQRYGTQVLMQGGRVVVKPIEDEANVDARRAEPGLPPMAEYLELLKKMYGVEE